MPAPKSALAIARTGNAVFAPLDTLEVVGGAPGVLSVLDGDGREYVRVPASSQLTFRVGGALGKQTARLLDGHGAIRDQVTFRLEAETTVDDGDGRHRELFEMARATMRPTERGQGPPGTVGRRWRGRDYRLFVPWVLDQANTSSGMRYVSPLVRDGVDLFADSRRADGRIWSFVQADDGPGYFDTVYGENYVWHDGGAMFVRQPVENHVEFEFVNMLYKAWQATGDDAWMASRLPAAIAALEYTVRDPVRWSSRFQLLKRPYTIDSWDFQIEEPSLPRSSINPSMTIDPERTKFGVFFGDNTGYAYACEQLATMFARVGRTSEAAAWRQRGQELLTRLIAHAWNGRFFRHRVEDDDAVRHDLGVDEAAQIAQANAYSLNRGLPEPQARAILSTYEALSQQLPPGSPGEWYAIYPPFGTGAQGHQDRWQYMNGGVSGHAAGELARGAFAHGFEAYGAGVLERARELAARTDRKIHFAYTGAYEAPPPAPRFRPVPLGAAATMDLRAEGTATARGFLGAETGNDLRTLPVGTLTVTLPAPQNPAYPAPTPPTFALPFVVRDPAALQGRAAVAVSLRGGFPRTASIAVNQPAAAVYVLHTVGRLPADAEAQRRRGQGSESDAVAAQFTFHYDDGSSRGLYLRRGVHVAGWWFPVLQRPDAGIAWRGANARSAAIGVSWAALPNPEPEKRIRRLEMAAAGDGSVYVLLAVTLGDRAPYHPPPVVSFGGPDAWAGSTMLAAVVEGLGGIHDDGRAMDAVTLSPRWVAANERRARVVARYPASRGYAAYDFAHDDAARSIDLTFTASARQINVRVLLPGGAATLSAILDGTPVPVALAPVTGGSAYAVLAAPAGVHALHLRY